MGGWGGRRKGSGRPRLAEAYGTVRLPAELLTAVDTALVQVVDGRSRAAFVRDAVEAALHNECHVHKDARERHTAASLVELQARGYDLCPDCVALAKTAKPSTL